MLGNGPWNAALGIGPYHLCSNDDYRFDLDILYGKVKF